LEYCKTDGGLYQWAEAMSLPVACNSSTTTSGCGGAIYPIHQGICPSGWHIPKAEEWATLETYLTVSSSAGAVMKRNNTGINEWDLATHNKGNSSGFSAFPAGNRSYDNSILTFAPSELVNRGKLAYFWEAEEGFGTASYRVLSSSNSNFLENSYSKEAGYSVRCLQDSN
jgi:uncharacterized protein (TIGR02145 family)